MMAKTVIDLPITPGTIDDRIREDDDGREYWPAGTVLDDPRAYLLVGCGVAEPADAECVARANKTSQEMASAQRKYEMFAKGIQEEDYQRYLDGELIGYDAEGKDIPGPNYIDDDDEESAILLPESYDD